MPKLPPPGRLRISSGRLKGRVLHVPAEGVRPTPGRMRQALLNMLRPRLSETTQLLELFCGTGAIGLEAYSQGCGAVVLVERDRTALAMLRANLERFSLPASKVDLLSMDAGRALATLARKECSFDIVFADPPYEIWEAGGFAQLAQSVVPVLKDDGLFIVQHDRKNTLESPLFECREVREYGRNVLTFFTPARQSSTVTE